MTKKPKTRSRVTKAKGKAAHPGAPLVHLPPVPAKASDFNSPDDKRLAKSAAKRDAAKAFEAVSGMEQTHDVMHRLISALYLIAEADQSDRVQWALYGVANHLDEALRESKAKRDAAWGFLWGYGPGAWRIES
jgi:hypothetical protein